MGNVSSRFGSLEISKGAHSIRIFRRNKCGMVFVPVCNSREMNSPGPRDFKNKRNTLSHPHHVIRVTRSESTQMEYNHHFGLNFSPLITCKRVKSPTPHAKRKGGPGLCLFLVRVSDCNLARTVLMSKIYFISISKRKTRVPMNYKRYMSRLKGSCPNAHDFF
ncbi:hypothetical protein CEXT_604001 [Caerostris extrusa]|uniref:Uncharacterized protein n=1 Tax=Caerostris extrusa TaxID=172846 RepID=A0AAV4STU9_CAEEX|nr:hypothetical protein CEXT_604001 [Caerostris extrusa]